jgi:uncharacterized protein (DUF433 family)
MGRPDLRDLQRARRLIVSDPQILGGNPVFRGTRIPVHLMAELVRQCSNPTELIEGYPCLTVETIRLASIYAAAHPLQKTLSRQPRHGCPPVHRAKRKLYYPIAPAEIVR